MKKSRAITSAIAALSIAAASVATAAPAMAFTIPGWTMTSSSPWVFELDCTLLDGPFSSNFPVWADTQDVTVNTSNCATFTMAPGDPHDAVFSVEWPGGITVGGVDFGAYDTTDVPASGSFTVHPNTHLEIGDGSNSYTLMTTVLMPSVDDPSGFLGGTRTVNLPSTDPLTFSLPGDPNTDYNVGGNADCGLEPGDHVYSTATVSVSTAGEYTFRYVSSDPASQDIEAWSNLEVMTDPFLAVYTTFDPANPDANIVGCDDDADLALQYSDPSSPWFEWEWNYLSQSGQVLSDRFPQFSSTLAAGTYTLVVTSYSPISAADWTAEEQGPVAADIELWGPQGSFELPNTGLDAASQLTIGGFAVLAGIAAITLVVWRRRSHS